MVAIAAASQGCTLIEPAGWPQERRPTPTRKIAATPGVMYGYVPLSWDLENGRTVAIDVDELRLPPLARTADVAFSVAYVDDPARRLDCSSELAPPEDGWFRCEGPGTNGQSVRFRLGPGQRCELSVAEHYRTLTNPACWRGTLDTGAHHFMLDRGHFERNGVVVGYVSWLEGQSPVLAANIVAELQIQLHDKTPQPHPADEDLVLATIALHWFEHATSSD